MTLRNTIQKRRVLAVVLGALAAADVSAGPVVYYSFNNTNVMAQTGSALSSWTNFNPAGSALTFPAGSSKNAQPGVVAGVAVSQSGWNNSGAPAYFRVAFNGRSFKSIVVSFWEQKSGTGPGLVNFQYSTNGGASFITFASLTASNTPGNVHTLDLSAVIALNNNTNNVFRLSAGNASGASGTFRIDNFAIDAVPEPPPSKMSIDGGGKHTTSASYAMDLSLGGIGGISSGGRDIAKHGYIGQLTEVVSVSATGTPTTVNESSTAQLSGVATYDDATKALVTGAEISWSTPLFPIAAISTNGAATPSAVYQNTSGTLSGRYLGVLGSGALLVLDSSSDNYGTYAGDGLPDSWQNQYFGLSNPNAAPDVDADGTGQNNLFKYVAGLDPTNAASVFVLLVQNVAGQPTQKKLLFHPITSGRTYTPESRTNLTFGSYASLPGIGGPQTNGNEVTVTDLSATQTQKFYRIRISLP